MKRLLVEPRRDWQAAVEKVGLSFHTADDRLYWNESICYRFEAQEIDELESATAALQDLCVQAAEHIVRTNRFSDFGIPEAAWPAIRGSWAAQPPSLYGRFDLAYDGETPPKLLEYNANTPTSVLEAAVVQWYWREEVFPGTDQFNSLHEKLIARWAALKAQLPASPLHFASMRAEEDLATIAYLRDTAEQAKIQTSQLTVREIGWNAGTRTFRDLQDQPIRGLFCLYPWEWLLADFADPILSTYDSVTWIEPIWKMLWSNKALLVVLWELFPNHPNLLPAYFDTPNGMTDYVSKPTLSREGANITVYRSEEAPVGTPGPYGNARLVHQQLASTRQFEGHTPVIGSWFITGEGPAGIGIRESTGITTNTSPFVPHFFL